VTSRRSLTFTVPQASDGLRVSQRRSGQEPYKRCCSRGECAGCRSRLGAPPDCNHQKNVQRKGREKKIATTRTLGPSDAMRTRAMTVVAMLTAVPVKSMSVQKTRSSGTSPRQLSLTQCVKPASQWCRAVPTLAEGGEGRSFKVVSPLSVDPDFMVALAKVVAVIRASAAR
jgi:hypothetical protein